MRACIQTLLIQERVENDEGGNIWSRSHVLGSDGEFKIKKQTRGAQRSSLNLIGFYLHKDLFTIRWRRACVTKDVNRLAQPVVRWLRGPWPSLATPRHPSPPLACDLSRRLPDFLLSATGRFAGRRLENISTCTYRGSGCLEQRGKVDYIADIKADSWVSLSARMLY